MSVARCGSRQRHAIAIAAPRDLPTSIPPATAPKWRGVFLMAPFTGSQLALSEIIYDGSLPAMLVEALWSAVRRDPVVCHRKPDLFAYPGWFRRPMREGWETRAGRRSPGTGSQKVRSAQAPAHSPKHRFNGGRLNPTGSLGPTGSGSSPPIQSPFRLLFKSPATSSRSSRLMPQLSGGIRGAFGNGPPAVAASCQQSKPGATVRPLRFAKCTEDHGAVGRASQQGHQPPFSRARFGHLPNRPSKLARGARHDHGSDAARFSHQSRSSRSSATAGSCGRSGRACSWPADSLIAHEDVLMLATRGYSLTHQRAGLMQCLCSPAWNPATKLD